jgi:hypothetical protein
MNFEFTAQVEERSYGPTIVVLLDTVQLEPGEKYTILEMGYASFLSVSGGFTKDWLARYGERIPEKLTGQSTGYEILETSRSFMITSHPQLVALALISCNHGLRGQPPLVPGERYPIPEFWEAVEIVRNREIFNEFQMPFKGQVPGLYFHGVPE